MAAYAEGVAKGADDLVPAAGGVKGLREAASGCRACPLWRNATQTVFGAGAARAPVMLIGEQPGDREDRAGKPFVGPAGQVLDRALAEAGIDPKRTYKTNVVKHFKWKPRGKRRIHQKPSKAEVEACRPWLASPREGRPRAGVRRPGRRPGACGRGSLTPNAPTG